MMRVLRGLPRLRNRILQGQASFARSQGLPDDHPEVSGTHLTSLIEFSRPVQRVLFWKQVSKASPAIILRCSAYY